MFAEQALSKLDTFDAETVKGAIWDYATEKGRGAVLWPLRYSLSGRDKSPIPSRLLASLEKRRPWYASVLRKNFCNPMRITGRMAWKISMAGALVCALPFLISAQTAEEIRSQISQRQAQLGALNKEIAQFEKDLQIVGTKKQTLQTAVNSLDLSVKKTQAKIKAIQNQIATTELEIKEISGHIVNKEESISLDSAAIAETIRSLHENDRASLVEMVLAHQSVSELWDDTEVTRNIQDTMQGHVVALEEAKEDLTEDRDAEEKKRSQLLSQRTDLKSEEQSLAVQKKEQQELLSVTKSQESSYQALLKAKQASKTAFEQSLNELESKLKFTLDPSKLPPAGKGILRWPLDNIRITQQFGRTADSGRLYSSGTHNGMDFAASIGTPVKAALSGTVTATGNTDAIYGCYSYGKWVLLKHANGLSTLYAHLADQRV